MVCSWSTAALRGGARWIGMRPARTAAFFFQQVRLHLCLRQAKTRKWDL